MTEFIGAHTLYKYRQFNASLKSVNSVIKFHRAARRPTPIIYTLSHIVLMALSNFNFNDFVTLARNGFGGSRNTARSVALVFLNIGLLFSLIRPHLRMQVIGLALVHPRNIIRLINGRNKTLINNDGVELNFSGVKRGNLWCI